MGVQPDDGVIKYISDRVDGEVSASPDLHVLNEARTLLFDMGLIGAYPDGVGYGNVSIRTSGEQFVITGSATGALRSLHTRQFSLVEAFSIAKNQVRSRGALHASSEAMTHGAIYAANSAVHCVMHVHSRSLFDTHLRMGRLATTAEVAYGTPAMAQAVTQLVLGQLALPVLFAMAGHDEGLVAYGSSVAGVLALLVETCQKGLET
jgi:hypothetical protein